MSTKKFWMASEFWVLFLYSVLEMAQHQFEGMTELVSWKAAIVAFAYILGRSLIKVAAAFQKEQSKKADVVTDAVDAMKEVIEVAKEAPIIKDEKKEPKVVVEDQEDSEDDKEEDKDA
jgi:hypothetical protein